MVFNHNCAKRFQNVSIFCIISMEKIVRSQVCIGHEPCLPPLWLYVDWVRCTGVTRGFSRYSSFPPSSKSTDSWLHSAVVLCASTKGVFTGDQDKLRPAWVCLFYAFTQDQPEILIPVSCKSQQISEWVQRFQACHFIPKPGTKHLFPVSCKQLQTFYTGTSSYWSEFVQVSCKYPLSLTP